MKSLRQRGRRQKGAFTTSVALTLASRSHFLRTSGLQKFTPTIRPPPYKLTSLITAAPTQRGALTTTHTNMRWMLWLAKGGPPDSPHSCRRPWLLRKVESRSQSCSYIHRETERHMCVYEIDRLCSQKQPRLRGRKKVFFSRSTWLDNKKRMSRENFASHWMSSTENLLSFFLYWLLYSHVVYAYMYIIDIIVPLKTWKYVSSLRVTKVYDLVF